MYPAFLLSSLLLAIGLIPTVQTQPQKVTVTGSTERERGVALYNQDKIKEAISALKVAVKKDKSDYQAWYFLGLAQIKREGFKDAAKSLEKTVELQPDFAAGHNALAYTRLMRNQLIDAVREAELALRHDPNMKEAHFIMGVANLRSGNTEQALKGAEAVIRLDPKLAVGYLLKSQALVGFYGSAITSPPGELNEVRKSRYLEATKALEKYLELDPSAEYRQTWLEQLESLRFYLISHDEGAGANRVYSGKEVTVKARVLAKPEPRYTEDARRRGVTGTVVLRCIFAADGTAKHFLVVSGLPYGLTERAIAAARKINFIPATIDGRPVSMFIQVEYNFNLY